MNVLIEIPELIDAMCLIRSQQFPDVPFVDGSLDKYTSECLDCYLRAAVGVARVPYELETQPYDIPIRNLIAEGLSNIFKLYPCLKIRHIEAVDSLGTVLILH